MLYSTNLKVQQLNADPHKSFEFKELLLHSHWQLSVLHVLLLFTVLLFLWRMVLRMPPFFYEFSMLLEPLVFSPANLLLDGDSNFHVNDPSDSTSSQFLDLLNCFNLDICNLCTPTHKNNNVLVLIIKRSGETSVLNLSVHDPVISDHFAVHCSLAIITSRRMPGRH